MGKMLISAKRIPVKSGSWNNSSVTRYIDAGQPVGRIWSYLDPREGRDRLHFMFEGNYGTYYYTEYRPGWYNEVSLEDQIQADNPPVPVPFTSSILSTFTSIGIKAILAYAVVQVTRSLLSGRKTQ